MPPDSCKSFKVQTNASDFGLRVVLTQELEKGEYSMLLPMHPAASRSWKIICCLWEGMPHSGCLSGWEMATIPSKETLRRPCWSCHTHLVIQSSIAQHQDLTCRISKCCAWLSVPCKAWVRATGRCCGYAKQKWKCE